MKKSTLAAGLLLMTGFVGSKAVGQDRLTTLRIKANEHYEVGPTNALLLDTLIMEDKATLRFSPLGQGTLVAKVADIGKDCLISSAGKTAVADKASGKTIFHGQNGGNLTLTMHFMRLASLTIDTSGGNGSYGKNGVNGKDGQPERVSRQVSTNAQGKQVVTLNVIPAIPAIPATPGSPGGKAGNGGDLSLTYGASDFIINFNNSKARNSLILKNAAGLAGKPGKHGRPGRNFDRSDFENSGARNPIAETPPAIDGTVTLTALPGTIQ